MFTLWTFNIKTNIQIDFIINELIIRLIFSVESRNDPECKVNVRLKRSGVAREDEGGQRSVRIRRRQVRSAPRARPRCSGGVQASSAPR